MTAEDAPDTDHARASKRRQTSEVSKTRKSAAACVRSLLPLINRQRAVVQLQNGQGNGRGVDRPHRPPTAGAAPTAVGVLRLYQSGEGFLAVLAPGEPVLGLGIREELGI